MGHLEARQARESQQEFDQTTASMKQQGLCRAYDGELWGEKSLSTCESFCGDLIKKARETGETKSLGCHSDGTGVLKKVDPEGGLFLPGVCVCDVPALDMVVDDVLMSLPAIAEIGCSILFGTFDLILEIGVTAIPGAGPAMNAGMKAAVQAAKTIRDNGQDANSFFQWFSSPCGNGKYVNQVNKIFDPLSNVPDSVVPGLGCKKKQCARKVSSGKDKEESSETTDSGSKDDKKAGDPPKHSKDGTDDTEGSPAPVTSPGSGRSVLKNAPTPPSPPLRTRILDESSGGSSASDQTISTSVDSSQPTDQSLDSAGASEESSDDDPFPTSKASSGLEQTGGQATQPSIEALTAKNKASGLNTVDSSVATAADPFSTDDPDFTATDEDTASSVLDEPAYPSATDSLVNNTFPVATHDDTTSSAVEDSAYPSATNDSSSDDFSASTDDDTASTAVNDSAYPGAIDFPTSDEIPASTNKLMTSSAFDDSLNLCATTSSTILPSGDLSSLGSPLPRTSSE
ncbi:MAG: hypothetical protein Q9220_005050 [cf. Caloplaca sp. 1 TL-2023]